MVVGCTWPEIERLRQWYGKNNTMGTRIPHIKDEEVLPYLTKLSPLVVAQGWPVQCHRLSKCGSRQAVKQVLSYGRQRLGWLCSRPSSQLVKGMSLHEVPSRLPRTQLEPHIHTSSFLLQFPWGGSQSLLKNPELRNPLILYRGWW